MSDPSGMMILVWIFIIAGIITGAIGVVLLIVNRHDIKWWMWALLAIGIILLIFGIGIYIYYRESEERSPEEKARIVAATYGEYPSEKLAYNPRTEGYEYQLGPERFTPVPPEVTRTQSGYNFYPPHFEEE